MKIICIGQNYPDHIKEMKSAETSEPIFFLKPETALIPARLPFFIPYFSNEIHYEVELVIKICRNGKNINSKFAKRYYHQISVGIDFTARDIQRVCKEKGLPWEKAKAFDFSAPVGTFIDIHQLPNPDNICFRLEKNGNVVQKGCSSDMIFSFDKIIEYVSRYLTLKIGDLIFTGTPAGVGPVEKNNILDAYIENFHLLRVKIK